MAAIDIGPDSNDKKTDSPSQIVVNELLSYVSFYRNRASSDNVRKLVTSFYTPIEINSAKKVVVSAFGQLLSDCPLRAERRKSANRIVHEVEVEDILGIFDILDRKSHLSLVVFATVNHDRIPKYGPEELNICAVADRQAELSSTVVSTGKSIDELRDTVKSLQSTVVELNNTVKNAKVQSPPPTVQVSSVNTKANTDAIDRSRNLVLFGVAESRDSESWRDTVGQALHAAVGRDVIIQDAFRLGKRPIADKSRPILVKLSSAWDRRAVVGGAWRLSTIDSLKGVFISPDLSLEERRRKTMGRLMKIHTAQGKEVKIVNGALYVEGLEVFTLEHGSTPCDG